MKKFFSRKTLLSLLVALVVIQFIHPSRNLSSSVDNEKHISKALLVPDNISGILKTSCYDCHSNNTVYPWYSKIQPVDWWMTGHIKDGKEELNFDEFANYNLRRQYHKLEEIQEMVETEKMPLNSYTWIHKDAILSAKQKQNVVNWSETMMQWMKEKYPADSLMRKK